MGVKVNWRARKIHVPMPVKQLKAREKFSIQRADTTAGYSTTMLEGMQKIFSLVLPRQTLVS